MSTPLISADSHVNLTQDMVKAKLATRYHAAYDAAVAQFDHRVLSKGTAKENKEGMREYKHPAFGRPGHHDPVERLKDMDIDGVACEVLYCEVSAFRYLYLLEEGWQDATRAFNDALHDFASVDPDRLVVSYQIPLHDIEFAVTEVERIAEMGGRSLQLPVFPNEMGFPAYSEPYYEPLWEAVTASDLPMCFHIGVNTALDELASRDPTEHGGIWKPMVPLSTAEAFGFWIMTGLLQKFPKLKLVFVEPGVGWVPWYLDLIDDFIVRQHREFAHLDELPSEYFRRNINLTFIDEPTAIQRLRDQIGVENLLWSTDYPHPISSWPSSVAVVEETFKTVPDDEKELMVSGNAKRVWGL